MKIDIASETWAAIRKRCEEKTQTALAKLMVSGINERTADEARGEIAAYQDILTLAEQRKVEPSGDYSKRSDRSGI
jgi:hypothetical protein